jgi:hypothetical protein
MRVGGATFLAFGFLPIYMCTSIGVEPCHGQIQSSDGSCDSSPFNSGDQSIILST